VMTSPNKGCPDWTHRIKLFVAAKIRLNEVLPLLQGSGLNGTPDYKF
jgi:hypothetical protein